MRSWQEAKPPVNTPTTFLESTSINGEPDEPEAVAPLDQITCTSSTVSAEALSCGCTQDVAFAKQSSRDVAALTFPKV